MHPQEILNIENHQNSENNSESSSAESIADIDSFERDMSELLFDRLLMHLYPPEFYKLSNQVDKYSDLIRDNSVEIPAIKNKCSEDEIQTIYKIIENLKYYVDDNFALDSMNQD